MSNAINRLANISPNDQPVEENEQPRDEADQPGDEESEDTGLGRKTDVRAQVIGFFVGKAYFTLTGKRPTVSTLLGESATQHGPRQYQRYGLWFDFLTNVFKAMGISGGGDQLYRAVADQMKMQHCPKFLVAVNQEN